MVRYFYADDQNLFYLITMNINEQLNTGSVEFCRKFSFFLHKSEFT